MPGGTLYRRAFAISLVSTVVGTAMPAGAGQRRPASAAYSKPPLTKPAAVRDLDRRVLRLALGAARCALSRGAAASATTLTIIDYSKASTEPRLWVFDLGTQALLYHELVAHGSGSGGNLAERFSNEPDSHQSSLGLFVTEGTYVGENGYSLRLAGLEPGFNDRAHERAIVMHGARYVDASTSRAQGRLGRSWGCPALRPSVARALIDRIKGGGLLFAYYPAAEWLAESTFLGDCGANTDTSAAR